MGTCLYLIEVHCTSVFILMRFLCFRMKPMSGSCARLRLSSSPLKSISLRSSTPSTHFRNRLCSWKRSKLTRKGQQKLQSLNPRDPVPMLLVMDPALLTSLTSASTGHQKDTRICMTGLIYMQPTTMVLHWWVQRPTTSLTTMEAIMEMGISTQPHISISCVNKMVIMISIA